MNRQISIVSAASTKDAEGFATKGDHIIASVRAYKEERRGDTKWANMAAFSNATVLYRFRRISEIVVDTTMSITDNGERFNIVSVDNTKGRGLYIELYAERLEGTVK